MVLRLVDDHDLPEDHGSEILLARIRAWVTEHERTDLRPVLACKVGGLDPLLDCWRCDELVDIVLDLLPRQLAAEDVFSPTGAEALDEFLGWLSESGLLHPDSDPALALKGEAQRLATLFPAVVVACSRYGFDTAEALARPPTGLPAPMTVVHGEALSALAAAAPALTQLRELVRFVGEGRRLTSTGNLRLADGGALIQLLGTSDEFAPWRPSGYRTASTTDLPEVDLLFRWALRAGFLQVEGTRVVPGPAGGQLEEQPLDAWRRATMTLFEIGVLASWFWGPRRQWLPPWVEPIDDVIIDWLCARYCDGAEVTTPVLGLQLVEYLIARDPQAARLAPNVWLGALSRDLQALWDRLATLDLIRWETPPHGPEGTADPAIRLSPLGQWLVRPLMVVGNHRIPLACELVGADAETLLAICRGWDWPLAETAIAAWAARRGLAAATAELGDFARDTTDVFSRSVAFRALGGLGRAAQPVVRALCDVPGCRIYATDWLVKRGLCEPVAHDPDDVREMLAENMAMVLEVAGAERMVRTLLATDHSPEEQSALIESLWEAREPGTSAALEALAALAPEWLAKAARKALLRRRTRAADVAE
ncbi:MAG: hypothetical protein ACRDYX_18180 [Egibacteraceae bacterium]